MRPRERQLVRLVRSTLPESAANFVQRQYEAVRGHTIIDYDAVWQEIIDWPPQPGRVTFPGAFVDWDNTPRYGRRAFVFRGASPARFEHWLRQLHTRTAAARPAERLIFLNAWNEWAEGAYIEPDERHRFGYLEAIARVVAPP
jgi:hypothetical protein